MGIKVKNVIEKETKEMRQVYCETLVDMAKHNDRVCILDADMMSCIGTEKEFQKLYPDRTFDCGVQEANMVGMAAGLAAAGMIPFAHTFAPFITRRAMDQVFISVAYGKNNVRLIGSDPGILAAYNGGTHMPFEDMSVMMSIPEMTVLEPADSVMLENLLYQLEKETGAFYIRMNRKTATGIYEAGSQFEIGKGVVLREGQDITIAASGIMVESALEAAAALDKEGISSRVLDLFTWKPIDKELLIASAEKTGAMVTAENHNALTGLGAAVSKVLCENKPIPIETVGVKDKFGCVGTVDELRQYFNMTSEDIYRAAKKVMERK